MYGEKPKRDYAPGELTQDERLLAAVSHGSVLVGASVIIPIIIWALQKDKSPYVRFQAMQAAAWQITQWVAGLLVGICYFCYIIMVAAASSGSSSSEPPAGLIAGFCIFIPIFLGLAIFTVGGIIGAIMTFMGNNFRYPIIANFVENRFR